MPYSPWPCLVRLMVLVNVPGNMLGGTLLHRHFSAGRQPDRLRQFGHRPVRRLAVFLLDIFLDIKAMPKAWCCPSSAG
ncbi:MAG: hypothetical protein M5R42_01590 [Rhodocyclaceae bacterium]|nr:hypothetical protein [Rhodocyclaceae bacterium]